MINKFTKILLNVSYLSALIFTIIFNISATELVENDNYIDNNFSVMDFKDYLAISNSSGDIVSEFIEFSREKSVNNDVWIDTDEVYTTDGTEVLSAKKCIDDFTSQESAEAREYYMSNHGANITEA